jgi:hypothetical protein
LFLAGWTRSHQFANEREWRIPRPEDTAGVTFNYEDVAVLVVPDPPDSALEYVAPFVPDGALSHVRVIAIPEAA